jgi:DNA-binding NarL/FixJ family response regulator
MMRLLAAGLTDEAAANRLGVSLRTVRRQVRTVMTRLQASSRFQAGYNAAERGWLPGAADTANYVRQT